MTRPDECVLNVDMLSALATSESPVVTKSPFRPSLLKSHFLVKILIKDARMMWRALISILLSQLTDYLVRHSVGRHCSVRLGGHVLLS